MLKLFWGTTTLRQAVYQSGLHAFSYHAQPFLGQHNSQASSLSVLLVNLLDIIHSLLSGMLNNMFCLTLHRTSPAIYAHICAFCIWCPHPASWLRVMRGCELGGGGGGGGAEK